MIFLGDICHPFDQKPDFNILQQLKEPGESIIGNLEGPLLDSEEFATFDGVFNNISILEEFKKLNFSAVTVSNNHFFDFPDYVHSTISTLENQDISVIGTTEYKYRIMHENGIKYALINAGWEMIGVSKKNIEGHELNLMNTNQLLALVSKIKITAEIDVIVVILHWNYELEYYPHPGQRQLAQKLIDEGANFVIGHHPHIIGPVEEYKQGRIFYSLGNWCVPHKVYYNGKLKYGSESNRQYILKINNVQDFQLYSIMFNPIDNSYADLCIASDPERLELPIDQYTTFFRKNRRKGKGLPIYQNFDRGWKNTFKNLIVKSRAPMVKLVNKILFKGI